MILWGRDSCESVYCTFVLLSALYSGEWAPRPVRRGSYVSRYVCEGPMVGWAFVAGARRARSGPVQMYGSAYHFRHVRDTMFVCPPGRPASGARACGPQCDGRLRCPSAPAPAGVSSWPARLAQRTRERDKNHLTRSGGPRRLYFLAKYTGWQPGERPTGATVTMRLYRQNFSGIV